MRSTALTVLALLALVPRTARAATPVSRITVSHSVVQPGQAETVTVFARDLSGKPLVGARGTATVSYGTHSTVYHLARTNVRGMTTFVLHPSRSFKSVNAVVKVSLTNGYISIPLTAHFQVRQSTGATRPTPSATPTATRRPGTGKAAPTSTPVPTPRTTPTSTTVKTTSGNLVVLARALPDTATAPAPVWVVVYVHTTTGTDLASAYIRGTASFAEGSVTQASTTDLNGVATLEFDTTGVQKTETVKVDLAVQYATQSAAATTRFTVSPAVPTATPLPTPVPTPTSTPTPVPIPPPVSSIPTVSATTIPTQTSVPAPTSTPLPTATSTPLPPTATATPVLNCPGSQDACTQALLDMINQTRAQYGAPALTLNMTESTGTSTCPGAYGHSWAMAQSGSIWHQNPNWPAQSFPTNFCVGGRLIGQNVGDASFGNELKDLQYIHYNLMMNEPHDASTCATYINHACTLINERYSQIGIGIFESGGTTWLTEDFIG